MRSSTSLWSLLWRTIIIQLVIGSECCELWQFVIPVPHPVLVVDVALRCQTCRKFIIFASWSWDITVKVSWIESFEGCSFWSLIDGTATFGALAKPQFAISFENFDVFFSFDLVLAFFHCEEMNWAHTKTGWTPLTMAKSVHHWFTWEFICASSTVALSSIALTLRKIDVSKDLVHVNVAHWQSIRIVFVFESLDVISPHFLSWAFHIFVVLHHCKRQVFNFWAVNSHRVCWPVKICVVWGTGDKGPCVIWVVLVNTLDHSIDACVMCFNKICKLLPGFGVSSLLPILNLYAGVEEERLWSLCRIEVTLLDKTGHIIHKPELGTKTFRGLQSHIMPITKDITCEGVRHVVFASPAHNLFF